MEKVYIVLQNGTVFTGKRFGATGDITAEIVFTTGMTGYTETLTDPSYHGQIVVQTFPLIGNYGITEEDFESEKPALSAYVVRKPCRQPSNFRAQQSLDDYLKQQGIIGVWGVDTRALTKIIRTYGVMNASVCSRLPDDLTEYCEMLAQKGLSADVQDVTGTQIRRLGEGTGYHVVLWDFGFKGAMAEELMRRGCHVTVVPAGTAVQDILSLNPDGLLLSNGPGDPAENGAIIEEIRKVMDGRIPILGICLGHQLLAHALGGETRKLKYGHRGTNQPVKYLSSGRMYCSSQNHGYTVCTESLPKNVRVSFVNVNDGTCEGMECMDYPAFSVQFHPEACGGPKDTSFIFDWFCDMMGGEWVCR